LEKARGRRATELFRAAVVASSVLGEREDESREQQGAWGMAWLLFVAAGARGGALPRRPSWATVAAALGAGGSEPRGDEDGTDMWGPGVSGWGGAWAAVAARPFGWARPRCWATQRAAVLRALGRARRGGELGRGRTRLRVKV